MRKVLKLLLYGAIVVSFLYSGEIMAQDCKTSVVLENVKYIGKSIGPGGQNVDQFSVSWGVRKPCGFGTGKASVVLKIKRLATEESTQAQNIDSSRETGNLINLNVSRGVTEADPKSWTVTITHTPSANSSRGIRVSGQGIPSLATATIGPIPGGPIAQECPPALLQAKATKRPGVLQGVWKPNSSTLLSLLQVQVTRPSGGADLRCFHGSITPTALTHKPASGGALESIRIDWNSVPPSCEKILTHSITIDVTRQDGTRVGPTTTALLPTDTNFGRPLGTGTAPIATYAIDLTFKSQLDPANAAPVTLTQSGNF